MIYQFLFLLPLFIACGQRVTIQPGEIGRQLTTAGLETENRPPGAFRLESCIISACPKLVRLQTQNQPKTLLLTNYFYPKAMLT